MRDSTPFPIAAPAFDGRSRAVELDAVFAWLGFGWRVFVQKPLLWAASVLMLIAGFVALSLMWRGGILLTFLLLPLLTGGLLILCRTVASGTADFMEIFTARAGSLMFLGVLPLLALGIASLTGGATSAPDGVAGSVIFCFLLFVPLCLSLWFAPALVLFNAISPLTACWFSLIACLKNILPLAILGLIALILCFFAALPVGLGFPVLIPVLVGTAYASYQDVFIAH